MPSQQLIHPALLVTVDDGGERLGQRINGVKHAGHNKRGDCFLVLRPGFLARKECVLPIKTERTCGLFSDLVADFDTAIIDTVSSRCRSPKRISHRLGRPLLQWQRRKRGFNPGLELAQNAPGMFLAQGTPLVSRHAADPVLDIVERADARQRFLRDR